MPNISLPSFSFFKGDPDTSEDGSNVTYETLIDTSSEKIFVTNNSTSRREFGEAILGSIDKAGSGGIHAIIPVKEVLASEEETKQVMLTPREVFSLLDLSVDSALARNIEGYTIGAIDTQSSGGEVFLLADIRSYDESFGALLDWEEDMASDLYNIFHQHRAAISSNNSFEDSTVRGYDARELVIAEDSTEADSETNNEEVERESILIYSLPEENKLILTRTSEALRDIILRLEE
ncbi:MAG: hypothetical protein U5L75_03235 [Candidatus Campbellbacteria bacterium]|nr:hypothetical protein [Candidatus Campbellbacteria bacterium]